MAGRLPDFLIVGAQRAGTTSLYDYLCSFPQVASAAQKEVHYFDLQLQRGPSWYRAQFIEAPGTITGEASPYYLFHPLAPARAAELVPRAKIVVVLRDPIERAYSHYHHEVRCGFETLTFADALRAEPERMAGEEARILDGVDDPQSSHRHHSYLSRGRYLEQLERWREHFPADQVLIVRSEDLTVDEGARRSVVAHLGVDWDPAIPFPRANSGVYPPMPTDLEQALRASLAADFEQVESSLGWTPRWSAPLGRDTGSQITRDS